MNVKAEKFEKARVNGGSNYDSLKKEILSEKFSKKGNLISLIG